jgi:hypothetical protein
VNKPVVEIFTLTGTHINTFRLPHCVGIKIIDTRAYKPGTYMVRLIDNGKTLQTAKFVKQ